MAEQMANGSTCVNALDCCVSTVGENGTPGMEQCSCFSNPPPNYATCADYAAQWSTGNVVHVCPGYGAPP